MSDNKRALRAGWQCVKFGDVARQVKDKVDPETSGLIRYVAGEHMDTDNLRIRRWGEIGNGYLGPAFQMRFQPGQVLYGSRRTYLRKVAIADFTGICANTTFIIETRDESVLLPEYLPCVMQTEKFHTHSIKQSKGSVNPYINFTDLVWFEFALPPIEEQRRIVSLLGQIEDQLNSYSDILVATGRLAASMMQAEFVDGDAPIVTLGQLCEPGGLQIGPFGAQLHSYDYTAEGIPVVMPADMNKGKVVLDRIARIPENKAVGLKQHKVRKGDILLPRRGELDRRAWIGDAEDGWLCGTGSIRIRVSGEINSRGVYYALSTPSTVNWLKANAVGTTMPNLNTKIVTAIPIKLPSQQRLDNVVSVLDELGIKQESIQNRSSQTRTLKLQLLEAGIGG